MLQLSYFLRANTTSACTGWTGNGSGLTLLVKEDMFSGTPCKYRPGEIFILELILCEPDTAPEKSLHWDTRAGPFLHQLGFGDRTALKLYVIPTLFSSPCFWVIHLMEYWVRMSLHKGLWKDGLWKVSPGLSEQQNCIAVWWFCSPL